MTEKNPFLGGIVENEDQARSSKKPVRNDVAQSGKEVAILRYFKIKKGGYEEFRQISEEAIWPYFEKIGARVVGMWKVVPPPGKSAADEYDEVYLLTRYASREHWKATREMTLHGGNGPDWEKSREAALMRRSMAMETHALFLEGGLAPNGPYFMPGLDENYKEVD